MRRYFKLCVSTGGQTSKRSPFPVGLTVLNVNAEVQDAAGHICFVPVLDVHDLSTVDRTKANFSFAKAVSKMLFPGSKLSREWVSLAVCLGSCKREDSGRSSAQCSWTRRRPTPTPGCAPSAAVPGADYATAAPRFASQHPTTQRRWSDCGPPLTLPRIPRRVLWRVHGCAAMAGTKPGGVDCLMWPATAYCPGQQIQGP